MNKIDRSVLRFVIVLVGLSLALWMAGKYIYYPYADTQDRMRGLLRKAPQLEAVTFGNSENMALDFKELGLNGHHAWMNGSDIFETKYLVENLLPRLPAVQTVFIAVPYFEFSLDNAAYTADDRTDIKKGMYASLPLDRPMKGDNKNFIFAKVLAPVVRTDHWETALQQIIRGKRIENTVDEYGNLVTTQIIKSKEDMDLRVANNKHGHIAFARKMLFDHKNLQQDAFEEMKILLKLLKARNIRVVFFTPPLYCQFTQGYDKLIVSDMKSRMNTISREFGVEYYDYSEDREIADNYAYFWDETHLNNEGARLFTKKFKKGMLKAEK